MSELEVPEQPSSELQAGDPNLTPETPEATPNPETPAPESESSRGLETSGLKFGDDPSIPSYLRGKTASEVAAITAQLYDAIQNGSDTRQNDVPQTHTPEPNVTPPTSNGIPSVDPNLIYSDPAEYHRQMEARMDARLEARIGQASEAVVTPMASLARGEASRDPKLKGVWDSYGPEIDLVMQRVPASRKGDVSLWKEAASIVAGRHVDDLAEKRAREIIASGGDAGMLSTQGGPRTPQGGSHLSPIAKLYADDHPAIRGHKSDGVPAAKVIAHAAKTGMSEEEYAKILIERASRKPQPIS